MKKSLLALAAILFLNGALMPLSAQAAPGGQPMAQTNEGGGLSPERKQAMRDELMKLPPDQRRERMQQFRQQFQQQHQQSLEERKQKFQERWGRASPEQRQKFCSNLGQRCSGDNGSKPACRFAQSTCAGNK